MDVQMELWLEIFLSRLKYFRVTITMQPIMMAYFRGPFSSLPGLTLHGYLSQILARSCQDLGKILAKILPRYWQELQGVMVRSYQESHVSKKTF